MALGIYISVPFCKTKCSYCNFASDVFSRAVFEKYAGRVCEDVANAQMIAREMGAILEVPTLRQAQGGLSRAKTAREVGHPRLERLEIDSTYLGGGTPTLLESRQLQRIFDTVRAEFFVRTDAEVTVECAPGTLSTEMIDALIQCGVNRVSLGVQSFIDREAAAVGRLHKRGTVIDDIARLRAAGIANINVDLIAGLPHQTADSWNESLDAAIAVGAPHVSVYMLEIDEDSRLGSELIAGGAKYHAHFVPDEDAVVDFYSVACEKLEAAGVAQYEISNFARVGFESRHNLKYWTRQPYLGFGVDAHSMMYSSSSDDEGVRFSTVDSLDKYVGGAPLRRSAVSLANALEETFFLGLRLNRGVDLRDVADKFGCDAVAQVFPTIKQLESDGLVDAGANVVRLTARGRLLSNEVFQAFLTASVGG